MIKELTQEQIDLFPVYVEKWTKIGLDTSRITLDMCKEILNPFYTEVLKYSPDPQIYLCDNPIEAFCVSVLLYIRETNGESVKDVDRKELMKDTELVNQIKSKFVFPYLYGSFDVGYVADCDYLKTVLNVELCKEVDIYSKLSQLGLIYCFPNFCVVSQKPTEIHVNADHKLHCENGPALSYAGLPKIEIYSLNGITVSKEIVMTPASELSAKLIETEKNVDIRREIVRKIGIMKVCEDLGAKVIDSKMGYEVLLLKAGDQERTYLKMKNPSIDVYHIEGIPTDCRTVDEALVYRKPVEMQEIPIDDENGENWYQQGDVAIWPKNAKSLKRYPRILT